ncbi:uncharacterized protein LOC134277729 [Saccostrea cucullata]|uniref:uncharacterized protein LOC134277729 n=1 Tax=Saccostrea cuccullata TaxID=36930 RepID=UPI002ED163C0
MTDENSKSKMDNRNYLEKLFKCAYFMIRKKWALTENFEDFVRFVGQVGCQEIQRYLENDPKITYLSSKSVSDILKALSDAVEEKELESLRNAPYFALLADESTDEANRTQFALLALWPSEGKFEGRYLGLINVKKTDAQSLLEAIQQFFLAKDLDFEKVRFTAFDGTNTMSGEISGLQRRVRHISPHCLYINCRNHRLALCLKHLMPTYSSLKDVDSVLLSLWKLFEHSLRRLTMFQDLQEMYGMKSYALVKAVSTRWLSHEKACSRVIDRYGTIIDILDEIYDEKKQPEVYGIRFCLTQQNTVAMMMLLCDVLKPLSHLSVYLQGEYVNFTHIGTHVRHATDTLHDIIQKLQGPQIDPELKFSKIQEFF